MTVGLRLPPLKFQFPPGAGSHAIEVELASDWKQSTGHELWCGLRTNRKPAIVLVIRDELKDRPHVVRLGTVLELNGLDEGTLVEVARQGSGLTSANLQLK